MFETSEKTDLISKALVEIEKQVKTPEIGGQSHYGEYSTVEDIRRAYTDALTNNGCSFQQHVVSRYTDDGNHVFGLVSRITHESGQYHQSTAEYPCGAVKIHEWGKLVTYLRRYTAKAIFNLPGDANEEDDGDGLMPPEDLKPVNKKPNNDEVEAVKKMLVDAQIDTVNALKRYKKDDVAKLSVGELANLRKSIEGQKNANV